jgi:hypothetical protein
MNKTMTVSSKAITKLTTPQLLKSGLYLTWGASLLLLIATISGVQGYRHAIETIGKDSAPSILTAQRLKDALAGMDANAVNELLVKPGANPQAIKDYEERRKAFAERIVLVAENITYDEKEKNPIKTMQLFIGDYITQIQRARLFNEQGNIQGVLTSYRKAAEIMDKTLLPAADELANVNLTYLEITYTEQKDANGRSLFLAIISSLFLIGILVIIQLFIYQRMRRIINPMLLGATAISLIFLGYTTKAFLSASYHLKVAKQDAFTSLYKLRQGRALVYAINSDESRYLLDKQFASQHQKAFFEKAAKVVTIPQGQTFASVVAAAQQNPKIDGFTGYLADALNNITFPGEKEAALNTLSAFGVYFNLDQKIRQLEESGKHAEAIAFCTGYNRGESNWAFDEFKKAHDVTLNINLKAFDHAISQGFKDVDGFEISTPVVAVTISLLTLFGLMPRIKEYSE